MSLKPQCHRRANRIRHRERDLIRQLEHLTGKTVTLQPGPDQETAA